MDTKMIFPDLPNERLCEGWYFWASSDREGMDKVEQLFADEMARRGIHYFDLDAPDQDDIHELVKFLTHGGAEFGSISIRYYYAGDFVFFWDLNPTNVGE